jgi:hypothetical protein
MKEKLGFSDIISIGDIFLTKKYIESLGYNEREELVEPIFSLLRSVGIIYPDDLEKLSKSYQRLVDYVPDLSVDEVYNNSSMGTDICKYFCRSFYNTKAKNGRSIDDVFYNDDMFKRLIRNRLGMDWYYKDGKKDHGTNEAFNLSPKMFIQGMRSMMLIGQTSVFKPDIAKYMCMKYSSPGDLVGDYSAGFGGRLLGAVSCGRRYIGTDPLTVPELEKMVNHFGFKDVKLICKGSEEYVGEENSVDLYWSSPPYFNQEIYSDSDSQAYNRGEDYFYNTYWIETLKNVKRMLKPGKWFGLNIHNYPEMLNIAIGMFGDCAEIVKLKTTRSHLSKTAGNTKQEMIYMFRNNK